MERTEEKAERHQEEAAKIAYDLGTLLMRISPNQDAMKEAAEREDMGQDMEAIMKDAYDKGEGSPLFRRLIPIWRELEFALMVTCLVLCVMVPSSVFAWDGDLSQTPGYSDPTTSSYDSLSGGERASADAYAQELLTNEHRASERMEQLQAPLSYGSPSYENPVHNFTAFGPGGTALKCTQTAKTVDCF